eukprot:scaffold10970_cov61-Cylindrotheca_fusiformis.AAC.1
MRCFGQEAVLRGASCTRKGNERGAKVVNAHGAEICIQGVIHHQRWSWKETVLLRIQIVMFLAVALISKPEVYHTTLYEFQTRLVPTLYTRHSHVQGCKIQPVTMPPVPMWRFQTRVTKLVPTLYRRHTGH